MRQPVSLVNDVVGRAVELSGPDVVDLLEDVDRLTAAVHSGAVLLVDIAARLPDAGLRIELRTAIVTLLAAVRPERRR